MKQNKYIILFILIVSLSSCGIFKKNCGCPHFGKVKTDTKSQTIAAQHDQNNAHTQKRSA